MRARDGEREEEPKKLTHEWARETEKEREREKELNRLGLIDNRVPFTIGFRWPLGSVGNWVHLTIGFY